jgi:molecular chaperone IbpA
LQLAIAGFTYDDLDIELRDGTLTIDGNQSPKEDEPDYLHRGISARNFRRTFTLSDTIVVNGATLDSGILTISLENVIPEEKKPRKIEISNAASAVEQLNG